MSQTKAQLITRDVHCGGCGYNLRTLAVDAKCPECGRSVARALLEADTWGADATWQRSIRRGLGFTTAGIVLFAVMLVSVVLIDETVGSRTMPGVFFVAMWVWVTLPAIVIGIGHWDAGTLEAERRWDGQTRLVTTMLRGTAVLRVAMWLTVAVAQPPAQVVPAWLAWTEGVSSDVLTLGLALVELGGWATYAGRLLGLMRIGRTAAAGTRFAWLMMLGAVLLCAVGVAGAVLRGGGFEAIVGMMVGSGVLLLVLAPTVTVWGALWRLEGEA